MSHVPRMDYNGNAEYSSRYYGRNHGNRISHHQVDMFIPKEHKPPKGVSEVPDYSAAHRPRCAAYERHYRWAIDDVTNSHEIRSQRTLRNSRDYREFLR